MYEACKMQDRPITRRNKQIDPEMTQITESKDKDV